MSGAIERSRGSTSESGIVRTPVSERIRTALSVAQSVFSVATKRSPPAAWIVGPMSRCSGHDPELGDRREDRQDAGRAARRRGARCDAMR